MCNIPSFRVYNSNEKNTAKGEYTMTKHMLIPILIFTGLFLIGIVTHY